MRAEAFALVAILVGCHGAPHAPVFQYDPDAAAALLDAGMDASLPALACASWAHAGCVEAQPECPGVMSRALVDGEVSQRVLNCVANAPDKAAIRACGPGLCP